MKTNSSYSTLNRCKCGCIIANNRSTCYDPRCIPDTTPHQQDRAAQAAQPSLFKEGEEVTYVVPPNIMGMMTGVRYAMVAHPRYRLVYEDSTMEEATVEAMTEEQRLNFFALVGRIQDAARRAS